MLRKAENVDVYVGRQPGWDQFGVWIYRRWGNDIQSYRWTITGEEWVKAAAGYQTDPSFIIPGYIMGNVVEAFRELTDGVPDPGTEAKVLREALDRAEARVDKMIDRALSD